jgi:hypothetical protein
MKPLSGLATGPGNIEAEFAEFPRQPGGKAGAIRAVEMASPEAGISDASAEHPIRRRQDGGGNRNDGLARPRDGRTRRAGMFP